MNEPGQAFQGQNGETLRIRNEEIPIITTTIGQDTLRFFVDNPRIYSVLRKDGTAEPSQEEIQRKLLEMEHVRELIQDIKRDGGLTDPIIVRGETLEVLEGNSRLAAYRHLAKLDPIKWAMIKVRLLPQDIDEKLILALLGQYHLKGKTAWPPFEKAGFLYRRHMDHNIPVDQLASEVGETRQKVTHMVNVYKFMIDNNQEEKARWSYYDEYLKSQFIKKERDQDFDRLIVDKIDKGEIARAIDVRDKLTVICKSPKSLKRFKAGEYDFEEAHESAVEGGADSTPYAKLARFRKWLATQDAEQALDRSSGETRNKIQFELKKLSPVIEKLLKKLSN